MSNNNNKKGLHRFRVLAALLLPLFACISYAEITPEVQRGLNWLQNQVASDGSLTGETASIANTLQSRAEALQTLAELATAPGNLANSVNSTSEDSTESLARKIISLSFAGRDVAPLVQQLLGRQAADKGFGDAAGARSNALDTAWALLALKAVNLSNNTVLSTTLGYLTSVQKSDGGFAAPGDDSHAYAGSYGLLALVAYRDSYSLAAPISNAQTWLKNQQNGAGHYDEVMLNALGVLALSGATTDASRYQRAIDALKQTQAANGSWGDDPYLTSLALRALAGLGQIPPTPTTGRIVGKVIDAANQAPLAGATVTAGSTNAVTGAGGEFTLEPLVAGTHTLTATKAGYATTQVETTITAGGTTNVGNIELTSAPNSAILRGQVTDAANGQALAGASVTVQMGSGDPITVSTGPDGSYQITGLTPGPGTITVSKAGYNTATANINFQAGTVYTLSPALPAEGTPEPTTATLIGQVVSAVNDQPIVNATVTVGTKSDETDAQGNFSIENLDPGEITAQITAQSYNTFAFTAVLSRGTNDAGTIKLSPVAGSITLSGLVKDAETSQPISGALITVQGTGQSATTGSDGRYQISGISEKQFNLIAEATGYLSQTNTVSVPSFGSYAVDFSLAKAQASGITLEVSTNLGAYDPNLDVSILVRADNQTPADKVLVFTAVVYDQQRNPLEYIEPRAFIRLPFGQYPISVTQTAPAMGTLELATHWYNLNRPAGDYRVVVQATNAGGGIVAEAAADFKVNAKAAMGGGIDLDPPISQASSQQPITITANVVNAGNIELSAGQVSLDVVLEQPDTNVLPQLPASLSPFYSGAPLTTPRGAARDSAGNVYVANKTDRKIIKLSPSGQASLVTTLPSGATPTDLAIDSQSNLWALTQAGRIIRIAPDGSQQTFKETGISSTVGGLDIDAAGNIYLTGHPLGGSINRALVKVTPQGIQTELARNGLNVPYDAVADAAGTLYVTNNGDNSISKIDSAGRITPFLTTGLNRPRGIVRDAAGNFYVANSGDNTIAKITPGGVPSQFATGLSNPNFLAFHQSGDLLVSNSLGSTISRISSSGVVEPFARSLATSPQGLAYDNSGNLYVANGLGISRLSPDEQVTVLTSQPTSPADIEVADNGDIFAANLGGSIVRHSAGVTTTYISGLSGPYGLALDGTGSIYVTEQSARKITRITPAGAKETVAESVLQVPWRVLADAAGDRYVLNNSTASIARIPSQGVGTYLVKSLPGFVYDFAFAPNGGFYVISNLVNLYQVNSSGVASLKATVPSSSHISVAADGAVYLGESNNRRISRLDLSGTIQTFVNLPGFVTGMRFGPNGDLYAATNNKLYRITPQATITELAAFTSAGPLAVGDDGSVYVLHASTQVRKLSPGGGVTTLITGLSSPQGIAVSTNGEIHVAHGDGVLRTFSAAGQELANVTGFFSPGDIEWIGDRLIFGDTSRSRLVELVPGGNPRALPGSVTSKYLHWDGQRLYVSSNAGVGIYNANGTLSTVPMPPGLLTTGTGVAKRLDGAITVANSGDHKVVTVSPTGALIASYAGMSNPQGLLVGSDGSVYVANTGLSNILKLTPDGKQSSVFAKNIQSTDLEPAPDGSFYLSAPAALYKVNQNGVLSVVASDPGKQLYGLASSGNNLFASDFSVIKRLQGTKLPPYAVGLNEPNGVRVGPDQAIYLAGGLSGAVTRYTSEGLSLVAAGMASPRALTFKPDGDLIVAGDGALYRVSSSGIVQNLGFDYFLANAGLSGVLDVGDNSYLVVSSNRDAVSKASAARPVAVPQAGTVVHTATGFINAMPVDYSIQQVAFGEFTPPFGGDYSFRLRHSQVSGEPTNYLHVGSHARGTINASPSTVFAGSATANVLVNVKGADFDSISKADKLNLRHLTTFQRPNAMGADALGNLYINDSSTTVKKITPDGVVSTLYTASINRALSMYGELPVDKAGNVYVGETIGKVIKVAPNGAAQALATLPTNPSAIVMDSQENIVALLQDKRLFRIAPDGAMTQLPTPPVASPRYLTIDGRDNLYIMDSSNTLSRIQPDSSTSIVLSEASFEYEGMAFAGDCADNLIVAPFFWSKIGQSGEEYSLGQIVGRSGQIANVFDGRTVNPRLDDMDFLVYDRHGNRMLMWTDRGGGLIHGLPITCGGISTDLHIVLPAGQSASGFTLAPNSSMTRPDGATEYVWNLRDVTNLGQEIRYDTVLSGLTVGEQRPIAQEAFLVFKNNFTSDDIKLPLDVPSVIAEGLVELAVTTDRVSYPARTDVLSSVTVTNPNDQIVEGRLHVDVVDERGNLVETILDEPRTVAPNSSITAQPPFNTKTYYAGNYAVRADFKDTSGALQDDAEVPFEITAAGQTGQESPVTATVVTDKPTYGAYDAVNILGRVRNSASNQTYENLQTTATVTDSSGNTVFTGYFNIRQLLPNDLEDARFTYRLDGSKLGSFTVRFVVTDSYGRVLATSSSSFTVTEDLATALEGEVTVQHASIERGGSQVCTDTIRNQGAREVDDQPIRQLVVRLDQDQLISSTDQALDLAAGQSRSFTRGFSTEDFAEGDYACVLQAYLGTEWQALGYAAFKVTVPPIKIDAELSIGQRGRLLVLLDGPTPQGDDRDPLGPNPAPPLTIQRTYLEDVLQRSGWSYTIVTTPEAFTRELRSGAYDTYALLSEAAKLDTQVQKELREAIYRGEGLLEAGSHDQRNSNVDDALGIKYQGKYAKATGVELFASELHPGGSASYNLNDKTLRAELKGAQMKGKVLTTDSATPEPSVTLYHYGAGQSVYVGFDLLAESSMSPDGSLFETLITGALAHVQPATSATKAGRVLPVKLKLTNQGIATEGQVIVTLSAGATVIDPGAGTLDEQGRLIWPYTLAEAQSKTLYFWIRLPNASAQVEITALVQTGEEGSYTDHVTETLAVQVTSAPGLPEAISKAATHKDFKQVEQDLRRADNYLKAGVPAKALKDLIQATDRLISIKHNDAPVIRQMVDQAIFEVSRLVQ